MKANICPPMHTAEHILNQTMVRFYNSGRCFSAHIEKKKSKCDYHIDHQLTDEEIKKVEDKINEIISADLPVYEEYLTIEEAKNKFNLDKYELKPGTEKIRIIRIGGYDAIPCIGPHVASTKEVGRFRIISSDFNDGVLRIRFKLG
jgi:misacylated tRNA(Ala) deacylase